jgi:glycine cleavage system transcriptional repressor
MSQLAVVSIFCPDRTGLVAAIAGCLFDLGGSLGDTTFAVLGTGAEFTSLCELPEGIGLDEVQSELSKVPELADAEMTVTSFRFEPTQPPEGQITHQIEVLGGDRPGLIARLCEVFGEFGANIVRLNAEKVGDEKYSVKFSVAIPERSRSACLATVANTAEGLQLECSVAAVSPDI